ncbi:hypothetical protein PTKIN_Ptkin01aG0126500 [Pterospermum kingtungense]
MAALGNENQTNQPKKIKRENLGACGSGFLPSGTDIGVNSVNQPPSFGLPDDILINIFSFLPIKEAIQASTVSPKLKQSWFFSRILCFDKEFAKRHTQNGFMDIVNHVFDHHKGPNIDTFSLFFDPTGVEDAVENWIQISIDKGVEVLDLNFSPAKVPYKITTDFADIETIKILKLCRCELDLLPTFKGLNSLTIIVLKRIDVKAKSIETLFSNCLSLETLELIKCRKIGHLRILAQNLKRFKALKLGDCLGLCQIEIDAPSMRSMYYSGIFILFTFDEISHLEDVILNFKPLRGMGKFFRRDDFLCDLSHIPLLSASTSLLEDLSPAFFRRRTLRFNFWNLRELQLFMENGVHCNLYHIAYFLKKCPLLEKLFIDLRGFIFEGEDTWKYHHEIVERDHVPFKYLEFIKMERFKFEAHELEMMHYLLEHAIVLKTFVLVGPKTNRSYARSHIIHLFPVSPLAKVFFIDPEDDDSPVPKHTRTWFEA